MGLGLSIGCGRLGLCWIVCVCKTQVQLEKIGSMVGFAVWLFKFLFQLSFVLFCGRFYQCRLNYAYFFYESDYNAAIFGCFFTAKSAKKHVDWRCLW